MVLQLKSPKHLPITWGFTDRNDFSAGHDIKTPSQAHGNHITEYISDHSLASADALFTTQSGVKIGVKVADCAPILFGGELIDGRVFAGVVHAGWRGATSDIWGKFIDLFIARGGLLKTAAWAIGPCIFKCHFQVGNEVFKAAESHQHWIQANGRNENQKDYFDLPGFIRLQARAKGLDPDLEFGQSECTYCNVERYYSYRRGDLKDRQYGWVKIE